MRKFWLFSALVAVPMAFGAVPANAAIAPVDRPASTDARPGAAEKTQAFFARRRHYCPAYFEEIWVDGVLIGARFHDTSYACRLV